jgi:hypothetical protein
MLKSIQTIVFGSAALIAVIATAPVTPAAAQGVPAGLLRLDSSQGALNDETRFTEAQQVKVRSAYASTRKHKPIH